MEYGIDQESLDLIIELQLQDAQNLIKGKYREGEAPDFELALECFNEELESLHTVLHDRAMTRSVARAVVSDADIIRELVHQEEQAARDRELALNGFNADGVQEDEYAQGREWTDMDPMEQFMSEEMTDKLIILFNGGGEPSSIAESSKRGGQARPSRETGHRRRCIIFIPAHLIGKYRAKELEFNSENRTYCHVPTCSAFIPSQFIKDEVATCIKCRRQTCVICKDASHAGDCPKDTATANVLRVAADNGWRRCYSCRRVVSLSHGCNHIYCYCRAEFCYTCGKRWKTCGCELWSEDMLVARNAVGQRAAAVPRQPAYQGWGL